MYDMNAGPRLKQLRERANLSVRRMAEALDGMAPSSYQHYEDKFKREFLPYDFVKKIVTVLVPLGIDETDIIALAGPVTGHSQGRGFSEGKQPRMDVSSLLADAEEQPKIRPANSPDDPVNTIKIAIVGDTIQIAATVDATTGMEELLRRLDLARQMIE